MPPKYQHLATSLECGNYRHLFDPKGGNLGVGMFFKLRGKPARESYPFGSVARSQAKAARERRRECEGQAFSRGLLCSQAT